MTPKQIAEIIENCHVDHLYAQSRDYDWTEHTLDADWYFTEATACEKCNNVVSLAGGGGDCNHRDVDTDTNCDGWLGLCEGPMMSYWYPCCISDPENAAIALVHLPLCVVEVDHTTGLALTGGGMDLSWEICAAYMLCGYLPPLNWCMHLPRMAGPSSQYTKMVLAGARRSLEVSNTWNKHAQEELVDIEKWVRKQDRAYAKRKKT